MPTLSYMQTTYEQISNRLRAIRLSRKLTLREVEIASHGQIKAISLGAYERGGRSLTVANAIKITNHYQIPLSYLLTGHNERTQASIHLIIDVRRYKELIALPDKTTPISAAIIFSFIAGIINTRQDFNGEVLSLRASDVEYLAMIIGSTEPELIKLLDAKNLILVAKN